MSNEVVFLRTRRRDGKYQVTCSCPGYPFPHRLGGGDCHYREDSSECPSCDEGWCEYHSVSDYQLGIETETLSAAQRNPSLTRRYKPGGWL